MSHRRLPAAASFVLLAVLCAAATSARQAPLTKAATPAAGIIVGHAMDGVTGKPLGGAIVYLASIPSPGAPGAPGAQVAAVAQRQLSDRDGHFVFHDLPAGSYSLYATKPGYLEAAFGRRVPAGGSRPVILQADERRGDCDLRLWRHATISGTVMDEAGEALANIPIRVARRGVLAGVPRLMFVPNNTSTDDRGRYRITSLAPGEYLVGVVSTQATVPTSVVEAANAAMRNSGFADFDREISRSSPMGSLGGSISLSAGQRVGDLLLTTPAASLGVSSNQPTMPLDTGATFVYPTTFYPSATSPARAQIVAVDAGDNKTGIDVQLAPVQSVRVSGTLAGSGGAESMTVISLVPASGEEWQRDYDLATATTIADGKGAFMFLGVPAGSYTLRVLKIPPRPVTPPSQNQTVIQTGSTTFFTGGGPVDSPAIPQAPTFWAQQPLVVAERDVTDLVVTLRNGARVTGRLEFSGSTAPPAADRFRQALLQIEPSDGRETSLNQIVTLTRGVVDAVGQFKTYEEPPGRYVIRGPSFPGWTYIGASVNGRDLGDAGLEIGGEDVTGVVLHFTDQPSDLSGTARDDHGADGTATILVFPSSPAGWLNTGRSPLRLRSTRAGTAGAYRLTGLPPGDYMVIALRNERVDWQDAKFLARLAPLATRVTIANGDHKVQDLQTKEVK